ncbi:DEAD/DEAH box helicase [Carboxylicivirga caseinilyticus]|uniref:DEAD/DEAH box helicase n=1 Tax=Carboxylicivirga caseinilyticus TaxID=3417572 RepID=UPI003D358A63|nr:DEAD/DEAH box helicase [Marinilabiliaceae bacterium A049]
MEQLVAVITEKRNIGLTLIPFFVEMEDDNYLSLIEQATSEHLTENRFPFSASQKETVKLLNTINEQHIFKRFSKQKTQKLFFDNLDEKYAEEHIRPYIDKKIAQALEIIALDNTPVYYKNPKYSRLYKADRINISPIHDEALFSFTLDNTGLKYTLKIKKGDQYFGLTNREILEVTNTPATFLINNQLYRFDNIDSKKFRPFMRVNHVLVRPQSVETYMNTFVQTSIRNHDVEAIGFDIMDKKVEMRPILVLEKDLSHNPVLTLKFKYDQKEYLAGTKSEVFVDLHKKAGHYHFTRFKRNKTIESAVIEALKNMGLRNVSESQYLPKDISAEPQAMLNQLIEWINHHYGDIISNNIILVQNGFEESYYTGKVKLEVAYTEDNDWFDINAVITVGEFKIPFHKIRQHILRGKREYLLPNKEIFIIPEEWFARFSDLMHFVEVKDNKLLLGKMHFNLLDQDKLTEVSPDWKNKIGQLINESNGSLLETPAGLNAQLRHYQQEGYTWMQLLNNNNFGGILADDMGLGKTIQTISLLLQQYNHSGQDEVKEKPEVQLDLFDSNIVGFNKSTLPASLIVMPTSLVHNWANEIRKFAPQLKVYLYTGTNRVKTKEIGKILRHYHVVLSSYGVVRNDIEYLGNYPFHYVILDESQNIKNPGSKIYQAVSELKSAYRLVLTGTPIENALVDLWAQMNFVNKGLLGSLNFFKNNFAGPIEKKQNEEKEKKLQQLITPFILRRTKEMVAKELPPVTEQVLLCDMTEDQQKFYDREKSGIRNELLKAVEQTGINKNAILALKALTKLRQIANHPVLVDDTYKGNSGKYQQIFEKLENIIKEKHKVLIFSSFVKDLELIEKDLKAQRLRYSKLVGSTLDRNKAVEEFTKNEDCRIFLISLKAGGVGLNLVEADYVFVLNPWWNPAAEAQAINRAHRIGQTKNVFVYKFISADSIEEKIMRLQEKKMELADTFITTNNPLKDISDSELKELFA